jgi:peptide/nickel transport system permease protein
MRTPVTVIGALLVAFLILFAVGASVVSHQDPLVMNAKAIRLPPGSPGHIHGTDAFGRDLLSRSAFGARISLFIALSVVALRVALGMLLGTIAGYFGGGIDNVICRFWDTLSAFPGLVLYLVMAAAVGPGIPMLVVVMTVGGLPLEGRLIRERVIYQRTSQFVEAALGLGATPVRVMFRHVLPNCLTPVLVAGALDIPGVILAEAALSWLGLGVPPPAPSWGQMISEGQAVLEQAPWISLAGGFFILLATLGFNLMADGLRDYLDPTQLR